MLGPAQQRADGTITLIKGLKKVIVDTGSPSDKKVIIEALKKENVHPKDINFVVCTHGHSDHIGNNNLFPNATFIVSYDVSKADLYTFHDFSSGQPYKIDDEIEVIPTKGHTKQDISVIVRTSSGVVAIVEDLFENEGDIENEDLWRSFSEFPEDQSINRKKILEIADFIVPGHSDIFRVKKVKPVTKERISIDAFFLQKSEILSELAGKFSTHYERITVEKIKNWLKQFGDVDRIKLALLLLQHVDYVDDKMIGDMFRDFYFNLPQLVKSKAIFTVLGGLQDSSSHIIYICSKALQKKNARGSKFREIKDAMKHQSPQDTHLIFVDDNIGSGKQAIQIFEEWLGYAKKNEYVQKLSKNEIQWLKCVDITYFVIIGFKEGINNLKEALKKHGVEIKVHPSILTEETFGCFQSRSLIFLDSETREKAKEMAAEIGYELLKDKRWPDELRRERSLGYGNSQKLIVFPYNTPTCTLPIFWKDGFYKSKRWVPLFPRKE